MIPISDENKSLTRPYVNYALIAANVAVFVYFYLQGSAAFKRAIYEYGMIPAYVLLGKRLYTVFTSMFMHGGILHIAGNMLYLYIFGDNVEDAFGHLKYLVFYFLCGVGATLMHIASLFLMPPGLFQITAMIPAVGASGAISGVLGAYMLLYPRARIRTLVVFWYIVVVSIPAYYYIGFWFFYQLLMGIYALAMPAGIAFWAHVGGFVSGVFLVKLFRVRPRPRVIRRRVVYYYRVPVY